MQKNLGSGKISFPKLEKVIRRERLFKQLDSSADNLITWVNGPPGAGKTTLVSSYLVDRKLPYIWLRCDKTDNDIASFVSYLSYAAENMQRGLGKSLPTFTPEYAEDVEPFLRNYFRKLLEKLKRKTVLILDDFHEISAQCALSYTLVAVSEEFNSEHSLIIVSRKQPLKSLARVQLNQQLLNIEWEELQLTEAETGDFIRAQGGTRYKTKIKLLHKLCKGWIAALKLMLLSENVVNSDETSVVDNLDQTLFFNYLAQETFNHLSPSHKSSLMLLSLFPAITREHYNLVQNKECNSEQVEKLFKQHLVQTFSSPSEHYKFHPLFRDFLNHQAIDKIPDASRNHAMISAADILLDKGFNYEAAEIYMQLSHYEKLSELVLKHGDAMFKQGRYKELGSWVNKIPRDIIENSPWLLYWEASSLLSEKQVEARNKYQKAFEQFLKLEDVKGI